MLSVVIPTYRKPDLLERTLAALAAQVDDAADGVEVIVVDDGSRDGRTPQVIDHFAARMALRDAGGGANEGRARARNRGWRAARGEVVLFLDDDIVLRPGALRAHVLAQREERCAWLGRVITAPEIVDSPLFDYLDTRGVAKHPDRARVPARYLLTQNVSLPRAWLESIGGFDEDFGAYGFEDMEIAFRLEDRCGATFRHLRAACGEHVHHHTLDEYLEKKELCGRETLPRIVELHPHRAAEMQLDLLPSLGVAPRGGRALLSRALRLTWALGGAGLLRALGPALPSRSLRRRAFDYLVLAAYERGLRQRKLP